MIKNKDGIFLFVLIVLCVIGCVDKPKKPQATFDMMHRTVSVGNWQFELRVENLNTKNNEDPANVSGYYLKAALLMSNTKTQKSLLYSVSDGVDDYEEKYKYLSFNSTDDLFIKYKDRMIYPIGYVFEPSNGLSTSERLVYRFQLDTDMYQLLLDNSKDVEYWYIDRMIGLGKICFTNNN